MISFCDIRGCFGRAVARYRTPEGFIVDFCALHQPDNLNREEDNATA